MVVSKEDIYLYLDGRLTFYDVEDEPRIIFRNDNYVKQLQLRAGSYIELNLDIVADYPYQHAITPVSCVIRTASSSEMGYSNYSTRNEMTRASSVNPTALAL